MFQIFKNLFGKEKRQQVQTITVNQLGSYMLDTDNDAMKLSEVFSCINLLSSTISTLPLKLLFQNGSPAKKHRLYDVFKNSPNATQNIEDYLSVLMVDLLLHGNHFAQKLKNANGQVVGLWRIDPNAIYTTLMVDGSLEYRIQGRVFLSDTILHLRGLSLDGIIGLSVLSYASRTFSNAINMDVFSDSYFKNASSPKSLLMLDKVLDEKNSKQLKEQLESMKEKGTGKVLILDGGGKFTPITLNPEEMMLIESKQTSLLDICRWFRVPPSKVYSNINTSYNGIEAESRNFYDNSILPWLVKIEKGLLRQMLSPLELDMFQLKFSADAILRASTADRASYYNSGINAGWLTQNEARGLENYPPMPGGDVLRAPLNLAPSTTKEVPKQ